jgi:hypothetical protein
LSAFRGLFLTCLAAGAVHAQPVEYLPFKNMSTLANPFRYYLDARDPNPAGLTLSTVTAATQAAWITWNNVGCAVPKATYVNLSSAVPIPDPTDRYDVYNVMPVWVQSTNDPTFFEVFGSLGITAVALPLSYAGELHNCDIFLNGAQFAWTTAGALNNTLDLQTVLLHETGHCLGLGHFFSGTNSVMQSTVTPGVSRRILETGDAQALCARYPTSNAVGSPCDPNQAGSCGSTGLRCITQPMPGGSNESYCSRGCPLGQNFQCELPMACLAASYFGDQGFGGACLRPTSNVTQVGKPCTSPSQCGSATALCQVQGDAPSGGQQWVGGYCSQPCGAGKPVCPTQSGCASFGMADFCLMSCRPGYADCRPGYACALTAFGTGLCVPRCAGDVDCGNTTEFQCRGCDGLCLAKQNPVAQIGDQCLTDNNCGLGQVCVALGLSTTRLCTQGCGSGCAQCPTGSSCHLAGARGERVCLRNCTGLGTCAFGLQCGLLPTGRGCIPPCVSDAECPVGTLCIAGQCTDPSLNVPDSGCALCPSDAGKPITAPQSDGGPPANPSGGCGCQTGFTFSSFATMGLLLLWAGRRERRAWRLR